MRSRLLPTAALCLLALLGCSPAPREQEQQWETVSEGGITVQMPGQPTRQAQTAQTAIGTINITVLMVDRGGEVYTAAYNEFPESAASSIKDPKLLLDNMRDGALRNLHGRLVSERHILLGARPGREVVGEGNSEGRDVVITARFFWASPRLVQVIHMREKGRPETPDGQTFLDSLEIH